MAMIENGKPADGPSSSATPRPDFLSPPRGGSAFLLRMRSCSSLHGEIRSAAGHADGSSVGRATQLLQSIFGPLGTQPFASHISPLTARVSDAAFGGMLADRVLGQRRTVILGASLMAVGHS